MRSLRRLAARERHADRGLECRRPRSGRVACRSSRSRNRVRASPARSRAGIRTPTARTRCSSATSIGTQKQTLDIPVGPNNRIEPGGPDLGQPTHFQPRRQWGVFTIVVPNDFGKNRLTWTIVANGQTTTMPIASRSAVDHRAVQGCRARQHPAWYFGFDAEGRRPTPGPPKGLAATVQRNRVIAADVECLDDRRWDSGTGGAAARAPGDRGVE